MSHATITVSCFDIISSANAILRAFADWEEKEGKELEALQAQYNKELRALQLEAYATQREKAFFGLFSVRKFKSPDFVRSYHVNFKQTPRHSKLITAAREMAKDRKDAIYCLETYPENGCATVPINGSSARVLKAYERLQEKDSADV